MSQVIVRFPPSPTGPLHLGGARTALFNYLFARGQGGKIFLRIEDTDRERSRPEFEKNIIDGLSWLGLKFNNEMPIRQSERTALYRSALEKLLSTGAAYVSKEAPSSTSGQASRREVIRFKNPGQAITFPDLIRGPITFETKELGDFVIAKSLNEPLYHLAVVADDLDLGVTHVIRGEDHISNTPRQMMILEALGGVRPAYAHIPLILASDRSKLSKRHGAVGLTEYRDQGFLPEAMINYLALLGWHPESDQEIFSLEELAKNFNLARVQKGGAVFNLEKLNWFNREYLKRMPEEIFSLSANQYAERPLPPRLISLLRERVNNFGEIRQLVAGGEWDYFFDQPRVEQNLLKNSAHLGAVSEILQSIDDHNFSPDTIKKAIMPYADKHGRANVLWPMRVALTGREKSPDPFTVASILGKKETLERLSHALRH